VYRRGGEKGYIDVQGKGKIWVWKGKGVLRKQSPGFPAQKKTRERTTPINVLGGGTRKRARGIWLGGYSDGLPSPEMWKGHPKPIRSWTFRRGDGVVAHKGEKRTEKRVGNLIRGGEEEPAERTPHGGSRIKAGGVGERGKEPEGRGPNEQGKTSPSQTEFGIGRGATSA